MTNPILKPCPFCGGEAQFEDVKQFDGKIHWTVGCNEKNEDDEILCYGYQSLTTFATKRQAADAWNKRYNPRHEWIPSTLGHGETMCKFCHVTNREAAILGDLDGNCRVKMRTNNPQAVDKI